MACICVSNPGHHWFNLLTTGYQTVMAGLLLIEPMTTDFMQILIKIQKFSYKNINSKMPSVQRRQFSLGLIMMLIVMTNIIGESLSLDWTT